MSNTATFTRTTQRIQVTELNMGDETRYDVSARFGLILNEDETKFLALAQAAENFHPVAFFKLVATFPESFNGIDVHPDYANSEFPTDGYIAQYPPTNPDLLAFLTAA